MSTILIIDDEYGILSTLQEALTLFGHDVETAGDGQEGIQKFDRSYFDVVITDVQMPGLDGNDVAQYIKNSDRNMTPIIAISGTPWLLNNEDFDMVLQKPFPLQTLIDSVENLPLQALSA